jgi:ATP-dependent DNA helicase RecQ
VGKNDKVVRERRHEKLSVFGIIKDFSDTEIKKIINILIARKLLSKEGSEFPYLVVTQAGLAFLKDRKQISLPIVKDDVVIKSRQKSKADLTFDRALFDELRILRKENADLEHVPPFAIFGDKSLIEMAHYLPQNLANFANISGVGNFKLNKFGNQFLAIIKNYAIKNSLSTLPKESGKRSKAKNNKTSSTIFETQKLIAQKMSLSKIATTRNLALTTIVSHLEQLAGKDSALEIEYLRPEKEKLIEMADAFRRTTLDALSPSYKLLNGKYSYEELKIARVFIKKESS